MDIFFTIAIALAMLAVVGSLFLGMFAFLQGGDQARERSNKFMRWRVTTQAVAIGIIAVGILYKMHH